MRLPVTPGHEFSGKVIKLGPDAEKHHKVKRFFPAKIQTFVTEKNLNFRAKNGIFLIGINGLYGSVATGYGEFEFSRTFWHFIFNFPHFLTYW